MTPERRQHTLTDNDIDRIVEAVTSKIHHCSFTPTQLDALRGIANGVNKTQKIASAMIIVAVVGAVLGGLGKAIYYYIVEIVVKGASR
jgi:hypothetical protein